MKLLKKVLRFAGLTILIVLAMMGIGIAGIVPRLREQDWDNEIKTEIAEAKESEIKERQ